MADDDETRQALLEVVERDLAGVEEALRRLDDGRYGRCDGCGATLDDDLLARRPTAWRCPDCDPG